MKILLIEPDNLLAEIYKQSLENAGHQVMHSRGAQQAVLLADGEMPDVVVLELQLSGHSGIEFLYEFRSYPEWQDIPVILHTLIPLNEVAELSRLGVTAHLYKPATKLRQLIRAVNETTVVNMT